MDKEFQNRIQHFTTLKSKYQATEYQVSFPSSLLYLILRKVDLGIEVTELELDWLKEQKLFETFKIIDQEQKSKFKEIRKLEDEFDSLKTRYQVPKTKGAFKNISNTLYPILWKFDSEKSLTDSEITWLKNNQLGTIVTLAHKMKEEKVFFDLKTKYQATKYIGLSLYSPLYRILNKLENQQKISYVELQWLTKRNLCETVAIVKKQEAEKQSIFAQLKIKYQADKYLDLSLDSLLYPILQKLDNGEQLIDNDFKWLEKKGLTETVAIAQELNQTQEFASLKVKYKANQHADSSPTSHLYKVLQKLESGSCLGEQDINFLKKLKLNETIELANEQYAFSLKHKINLGELLNDSELEWLNANSYKDIIQLAQKQHFVILKRKYGLIDPNLPMEPFSTIMLKLEKKERLDIILVSQLMEQSKLSRHGQIAIAHYKLEAEFYEQEFKRTGSKWHIPTASSYWRKADNPEQALNITNLDLQKIKDSKLKSAILVTRGGAFRDMDKLADAENCARKAMEYQPNSYQPYTLMGAIDYDLGDYSKGDYWFEEAIKRGAKTNDIDDEIKRIFRSTKDENKRHEAALYLLNKDPHRYAWAKSYRNKI